MQPSASRSVVRGGGPAAAVSPPALGAEEAHGLPADDGLPDLPVLPPEPPTPKMRPLRAGGVAARWVLASRRPRERPWL